MQDIIKEVLTSRVYDIAIQTPLDAAKILAKETQNNVYLKREDLQSVFSFKIRGAYNKISQLTKAEQAKGIICSSAGNHAQGVALSGKKLGLDTVIVMPKTTPMIKIAAVEAFGGKVVLEGNDYTEAAEYCQKLVKETGMTYIPPYDDPQVIAGQGTIGHEILQQLPNVDVVFVPVGGGGLISGVSSFLKAIRPEVKIIGVEPVDSDAMFQSVQLGKQVVLPRVGIFADGVAVKKVGDLTFKCVQKNVDEIIRVSTDEICSAIKAIYEDTRSIVEPAGALGVAGLRKYVRATKSAGLNLVAINSGANMNFDRLQFVAERTRTGERREALFAVTIPEKPGALRTFCDKFVGDKNISEFNYRLTERTGAHIFVGIGILKDDERADFKRLLDKNDYSCQDLTDNELAKTHIRHMVGGKSTKAENELLYSFQFPERPQALSYFLNAMSETWNISLFHYRMHGGDFGRVLIGFEIQEADKVDFQQFLEKLNYSYTDEMENPAYKLFL